MRKLFTLSVLLFLFITSTYSQVDVSGAVGGNGSYSTLAAAFTAINGTVQTGSNISITISGNTTETVSAVLNAGAWTTLTIQPTGGAGRTITGSLTAPLIDLNGADNVTFDGLNSGGNSLTIQNTNTGTTSTTSTFRFIGDATGNTITNCSVQGSMTMTLATNGGVIFFSTAASGGNGNDNNTISNCNIGPAGVNLPSKCVYGNGSTTNLNIANSGNIITNNNIFDFFNATTSVSGIYLNTGNHDWTLSNNRLYQTAARTFTTTALRYAGITIAGGTLPNHTITGNVIGFGSSSGTGTTTITGSTNTFRGIDIPSVSSAAATSIQGNTISGINQTTASTGTGTSTNFVGIMLGTTQGLFNVGTITGNNIGSLDGSSTIVINASAGTGTVNGIYDFSVSSNNISNNNIGSITIQGSATGVGFRGILVNTGTGLTATINNNTIANITDNLAGSYAIYGIQTALPNISATGNTIRNFTGNSTGLNLIISGGILTSGSTGVNTISQNTIHSLHNNSGAISNSIYGMSLAMPVAANIVERNYIHSNSITGTATTCQLWGISGGSTGTTTYRNNIVRLGFNSSGTSITSGFSILGFRDATGATNNWYNNSCYIGGTGVTSASSSYCFYSDAVTVTRSFQNNIFWNARSNSVTGGVLHIAYRVGGTTVNPTGLTSNYNLMYATGNDGYLGVFNGFAYPTMASFRTATGTDGKSISRNPNFVNPTGTSSTLDLHISPTSLSVNGRGTYIAAVTNDFDGNSRPTSQSTTVSPVDMGADQYTPSGFAGNTTDVSGGNTLVDGELMAIELVDGEFNFTEILQFTGIQTPNNTFRPSNSNKELRNNVIAETKNTEPINFTTQNNSSVTTQADKLSGNTVDVKAESIPVETFTKVTDESNKTYSTNGIKKLSAKGNVPNNNVIKKRKDGNSGGESNRSAVNTPWVYWQFIDFEPNPLEEPIIIRFYYNDEQLATINESALQISYWDGSTWDNSFTQTVNTTANYIELTLPDGLAWPPDILFAMEDNTTPLPVLLSEFNVTALNRDANLKWVTSSEVNNKGFAVERRALLSSSYSDWKEIAFVNGKGTTNEQQTYTYSDKKLNSGTYQYRLRQVDYNGNFEHFSPGQNDIVIGKPGIFDIGQNYPNPSNPKSKIDFQMPFDGMISIKIYDILGQEVKTLINEFRTADFYTVEFDGSGLASGTYFYRVTAEGSNESFTKTLKMILVK